MNKQEDRQKPLELVYAEGQLPPAGQPEKVGEAVYACYEYGLEHMRPW